MAFGAVDSCEAVPSCEPGWVVLVEDVCPVEAAVDGLAAGFAAGAAGLAGGGFLVSVARAVIHRNEAPNNRVMIARRKLADVNELIFR